MEATARGKHSDGWSGEGEVFRKPESAVVLTARVGRIGRTCDDIGPDEDVVWTGVGLNVRNGGFLNVSIVAGETKGVDRCSHNDRRFAVLLKIIERCGVCC